MLSLTNRDYESILEDLKREVSLLTDNWTDFSDSDIGVVWLKTLAGLSSMLHFYIDKQVNENYIGLAKESKNIESILEILGYRKPLRSCPKSTVYIDINLTVSDEYRLHNDVIIPKFTTFTSRDKRVTSVSAEDIYITPFTQSIQVPLYLGLLNTKSYPNSYLNSYKFYLPKEKIAEDEFELIVDGVTWERVDNAFLELDGGMKYSIHRDAYDSTYLLFTHDYTDYVSTNGIFIINYLTLQDVESTDITISNIDIVPTTLDGVQYPDLLSFKSTDPFVGGFDSTDSLLERAKAQKISKVLDRVVTLEDYRNFCLSYPGVQDVEVSDISVKNTTNPKPYEIDIFILLDPTNNTYESMSQFFKDSLSKELSSKQIFGNVFHLKDATIRYVDIDLVYYVKDKRYLNSTLSSQISETVRNLFRYAQFNKPLLVEEIIARVVSMYSEVCSVKISTESVVPNIGECILVNSVSVRGEEYNVRI